MSFSDMQNSGTAMKEDKWRESWVELVEFNVPLDT